LSFMTTLPHLMQLAFDQALVAFEKGEVPVGAVVAKGSEILGLGHNLTLTLKDPTAHAEIMAIRDATSKLGDWRLSDCQIYVTLEPCTMCVGAILLSRIETINFLAYDPKDGACGSTKNLAVQPVFGHCAKVIKIDDGGRSSDLIREFFRLRRENK